MSRGEQLEKEIAQLDPAELRDLRQWFLQYDAEFWDQQIESDAKSGKLSKLTEQAACSHQSGRSTPL